MKKILIIGSGGAGKSTIASKLGERLNIPVTHLDKYYWKPGWVESPSDEWREKVQSLVKYDQWIMDGNYKGTFDIRFKEADTIVILDFPPIICIFRSLKRRFQYWNQTRPDMVNHCPEKLIEPSFFRWVWNFLKDGMPIIENCLQQYGRHTNVIRLKSPKEVNQWVDEL